MAAAATEEEVQVTVAAKETVDRGDGEGGRGIEWRGRSNTGDMAGDSTAAAAGDKDPRQGKHPQREGSEVKTRKSRRGRRAFQNTKRKTWSRGAD